MRISLVSVPVSDPDRAKKFYVEVLGFTELTDNTDIPGTRWVMLAPPGGGAAITLVTWFPSMPAGSLKGLVYEVDDVDAWLVDVTAKGLDLPAGVQEEFFGRYVTLDDPDGNGIVVQTTTR
ncbi:MAG TPA: VOC family protein [Pseudonocardiaceae bacterium]|nr:VOC family protein [Pseudonocardiaceae bacterium]